MQQARRANRRFPPIESGAVDGEREKQIGVSNRVVVEVISRPLMIVVYFEGPAAQRNRKAELVLLVALAAQGINPSP